MAAGTAVAPVSGGNPSTENDTGGWTQHATREGRPFWYHAATGKSTWEKPDALKSDLEKLMASQTSWKEYTAADGRPYWYNKETKASVWACPEEVQRLKDELDGEWCKFTEKGVAKDRLKTLFKLKGVGVRTRFDEALNLVKSDSRFTLFSILTTGEKKQVLSEYQSQIQKQLREKERSRKVEARKNLLDALAKWDGFHPAALLSTFQKTHENAWWMACLPDAEKEDLFNDYIEENQEPFFEKQRDQRNSMRQALMEYLRTSPKINVDMRWAEVIEVILDEPRFAEVEPRSLFTCWEEFVFERDREEKERHNLQVQRSRRRWRDAFRNLVQEKVNSNEIHARMSFAEFINQYHDHPSYLNLVGVPATTPREIFEAVTDPLLEVYEQQKALLKRVLKTHGITVTPKSTLESFREELTEKAPDDVKILSDVNCRLFFESLMRRALRRAGHEKRGTTESHDEQLSSSFTAEHLKSASLTTTEDASLFSNLSSSFRNRSRDDRSGQNAREDPDEDNTADELPSLHEGQNRDESPNGAPEEGEADDRSPSPTSATRSRRSPSLNQRTRRPRPSSPFSRMSSKHVGDHHDNIVKKVRLTENSQRREHH